MTGVTMVEITPADSDQRLDRWFKRRFPELAHGRLEKLLRTGQIRVDGARAKAATRLTPGMILRIPPIDASERPPPRPRLLKPDDIAALRAAILFIDDEVIAIDKPPGLAVQGGTGTTRHLDGMLDALQFEAPERPRLVHRLDKDTSGVLLLARSAASARWLTKAFRDKATRKIYWAVVAGLPKPRRGRIDLAIGKSADGDGHERVRKDEDDGKPAVTYYAMVDHAGPKAAWLALMPMTGRTHQLRVHCAAIGTPILGDDKYGGGGETLEGMPNNRRLHLHARALRLPRPDGAVIAVEAPLPAHMAATWAFLGFAAAPEGDPFADLGLDP
jgi:23S rRNA pseudouridine955/2504/2580 synthase